jgi:hypothetical protein
VDFADNSYFTRIAEFVWLGPFTFVIYLLVHIQTCIVFFLATLDFLQSFNLILHRLYITKAEKSSIVLQGRGFSISFVGVGYLQQELYSRNLRYFCQNPVMLQTMF